MPLYEPERHEALTGAEWSEQRARAAIERIVADTQRGRGDDGLWPLHPFDVSPERPAALKPLYYGAAGVIWALDYLAAAGAVKPGPDYLPTLRELPERSREDLRQHETLSSYAGSAVASYLMGEAGMLMLHSKLQPRADLSARIHDALRQRPGDARGLIWGAAGSMLAALFMHERTGESRWATLFRSHYDALEERWRWSDELGCHVWTEELYGVTETRLGALQGFFANALPILRGRHLFAPEQGDQALERIWATLRKTAMTHDGCANWPHDVGASTRPDRMPLLVQFCSGAPGAIACLSAYPQGDARWPVEELLRAAGELIWRAGPTRKFPVLCHGAAGSGYALLKLHARTGETRWLERARAFAMHGVAQADRALESYGQRKYSLWTGDLGLAVFLLDCIRATPQIPTLDVF